MRCSTNEEDNMTITQRVRQRVIDEMHQFTSEFCGVGVESTLSIFIWSILADSTDLMYWCTKPKFCLQIHRELKAINTKLSSLMHLCWLEGAKCLTSWYKQPKWRVEQIWRLCFILSSFVRRFAIQWCFSFFFNFGSSILVINFNFLCDRWEFWEENVKKIFEKTISSTSISAISPKINGKRMKVIAVEFCPFEFLDFFHFRCLIFNVNYCTINDFYYFYGSMKWKKMKKTDHSEGNWAKNAKNVFATEPYRFFIFIIKIWSHQPSLLFLFKIFTFLTFFNYFTSIPFPISTFVYISLFQKCKRQCSIRHYRCCEVVKLITSQHRN